MKRCEICSLTLSPAVGLVIGFIFGATNIIRFGPGPNGMMRTLGQYMVGSAATFGYVNGVTAFGESTRSWYDFGTHPGLL